jgi:hypothetical protein
MLRNVPELSSSNILMAKEGVAFTPLRMEHSWRALLDEILSTGNYSKVVPVTRIGDRSLPFGHLYARPENSTGRFCASITGSCVLFLGRQV